MDNKIIRRQTYPAKNNNTNLDIYNSPIDLFQNSCNKI